MQIQQVRLQNFRGIKHLELNFDLSERFAVLVGVNGVGKSSILDCISAMVRSYGLIATDASLQGVFSDRDIYINEVSTRNGITGIFGGLAISWDLEKLKGFDETSNQSGQSIKLIKETSDQYDRDLFVSVYYAASRRAIQIQQDSKNKELENSQVRGGVNPTIVIGNSSSVGNIFFQANYDESRFSQDSTEIINFKEFTRWFQTIENLENETRLMTDGNYRDLQLEATRKAVYSILGGQFSQLRMKRALNKLTIQKAGKEIELDWLSDGEKGLLALASDLARRLAITYPDSPDPLQGEGLVLIDEIELHLHPAWQRIIIQRLTETFPNCQFIVTTHSPQVLSQIQPECIHVLAIENDSVIVKRPESSYGRDSNRILEDIMGVPKRLPEIEDKILAIFRMIHDGEIDRAKSLIRELAEEIGIDEPELIRATSAIRRREVIGR
jgi:predicted ATP-binding protein involved in virulence